MIGLRAGWSLWQDLTQGVLGGREVLIHVDVRDVERIADFVKAVRFAVFGQHLFDLQPGRAEQIPQSVLVFVAVHAPPGRAALRRVARAVGGDQRSSEGGEKSHRAQRA